MASILNLFMVFLDLMVQSGHLFQNQDSSVDKEKKRKKYI